MFLYNVLISCKIDATHCLIINVSTEPTSPPAAKAAHVELKELAESMTEQVVAIHSKAGLDLPIVNWRMMKNAQETLELSHPGLYDGSFLDILKEKPK